MKIKSNAFIIIAGVVTGLAIYFSATGAAVQCDKIIPTQDCLGEQCNGGPAGCAPLHGEMWGNNNPKGKKPTADCGRCFSTGVGVSCQSIAAGKP